MKYQIKKIEGIDSPVNYYIDTLGVPYTDYLVPKGGKLKEIKVRRDKYGYLKIALRGKDTGKRYYLTIHQLVAKAFIENDDIKNKTTVNHINNIKTDNRVENLEWMSIADNNRYRFECGFRVDYMSSIVDVEDAKNILKSYYFDKLRKMDITKMYPQYSRGNVESIIDGDVKSLNHLFQELGIGEPRVVNNGVLTKEDVLHILKSYFEHNMTVSEIHDEGVVNTSKANILAIISGKNHSMIRLDYLSTLLNSIPITSSFDVNKLFKKHTNTSSISDGVATFYELYKQSFSLVKRLYLVSDKRMWRDEAVNGFLVKLTFESDSFYVPKSDWETLRD